MTEFSAPQPGASEGARERARAMWARRRARGEAAPRPDPEPSRRALAALRGCMRRYALTQGEVGALLGLPQTTISRWLRGATTIHQPILLLRALRDARRELDGREGAP